MSVGAFMLVLLVGSALLALWIAARLPRLSPRGRWSLAAALVAGVVALGAAPLLVPVVGRPLGAFAAIFLVVLPACTYIFLAALWLLGYVSRLLRPS